MVEERPIEVRVASLAQAEEIAKEGWAERVVSLIQPEIKLPDFRTFHDVIWCYDTEGITDIYAPKYHDIAWGLDFSLRYSRMLIHCEGGISRSTAFAIGVLVKFGLDIQAACDYVHEQQPNMNPNWLVLSHCERYLQLDGLLVPQVQTIVSKYDKGLVLWCNECKVHFKDGDNCPGKHFMPAPDEDVYV